MTLVLDVGSGASLPDTDTARRMVDAVKGVDSGKHKIVLKAQLFESAPPNVPLNHDVFIALYRYGKEQGYEVTASVFDLDSLHFLLSFKVPFVKIACRPSLYWLAGEVPRKVPVWVSVDARQAAWTVPEAPKWGDRVLWCVPEYPAKVDDYGKWLRPEGFSDHTVGWDLYRRHNTFHASLVVLEKHIRLPDTTGPDAGPWSVLPEQLKEIM